MSVGSPEHVALWDAIAEVVAASGGSTSTTSVARQKAVVRVESAVAALVAASLAQTRAEVERLRAEVRDAKRAALEEASEALRKTAGEEPDTTDWAGPIDVAKYDTMRRAASILHDRALASARGPTDPTERKDPT